MIAIEGYVIIKQAYLLLNNSSIIIQYFKYSSDVIFKVCSIYLIMKFIFYFNIILNHGILPIWVALYE